VIIFSAMVKINGFDGKSQYFTKSTTS